MDRQERQNGYAMNDFDEQHALIIDRLAPLHRALAQVAAVLDRGRLKHPEGDGFRQPAGFHIERARLHMQALERAAERHLRCALRGEGDPPLEEFRCFFNTPLYLTNDL
jgi:hypothetical protein